MRKVAEDEDAVAWPDVGDERAADIVHIAGDERTH
jgi:hypothetical protein